MIREPFKDLLSLDNVKIVAKALDLHYDYANLFQSARVVTDIRPLFDDDGTKIKAAVVSFTLRLYFDNREGDHSLSLALDEADVQELMKQCERALVKAKTAKSLMERNRMPILVAGDDSDD